MLYVFNYDGIIFFFSKFKKENSETLIYDLDQTLNNLGVGPYQFKFFFLMGLMLVFSNISPLNHIMYNSDLKYR